MATDPKLNTQKVSVQFTMAEFKKLDSTSQLEIANKVYAANPASFIMEAFNLEMFNPQGHLPVIPKEVVEMDDILTQQVISTYQQEIKPLLILTGKN